MYSNIHLFNRKLWSGIPLLVLFLFTSCEKEEIAIKAHEKGDVSTAGVSLKPDYRFQAYFDLESNKIVRSQLKTAWDLGFESAPDGFHIVVNTSKAMQVVHLGVESIEQKRTIPSDDWKWDHPDGNMNKTAIGEWATATTEGYKSKNEIYLLDLGYDHLGNQQGYKKLEILGLKGGVYSFRFTELDGTKEKTISIAKDENYNFSFFSFQDEGKQVTVEPPKKDWDLVFTQYTHLFGEDTDEPSIYLVTGVLQNRFNTNAILDTLYGFDSFSYEKAVEIELSPSINTIGYNWKEYQYGAGSYVIQTENNYVIQSSEGFFYKLHFTDFYTPSGEKGTPTFEYQKL